MCAKKQQPKLFVLDTSVILYDHRSLTQFQEHDVAVPITVLEELDQFKKGNDSLNFEARQFIRLLDQISGGKPLHEWIRLPKPAQGRFRVVMHQEGSVDAEKIFNERKADHRILNAAISLREQHPGTHVVLVTKDVNLRLKARSLEISAEDYETGKIKDVTSLETGVRIREGIAREVLNQLFETGEVNIDVLGAKQVEGNSFWILKSGRSSALAFHPHDSGLLCRVDKRAAYGIQPRNAEQTFAIHAVMNRDIPLVTIQGMAGTGKTLLALAGALEMRSAYRQIYLARPIVPLSNKDIGFLPGDIKAKINPYMDPLWDNLKVIQDQFDERSKDYQRLTEMVALEKLVITPLAYIRGRSLSNIIFIVDEAQNLTPHEVKTIITRAGEHTKIIFTGDIHQIDTPYLDAQSNGLSYLIDRMKGQPLYAHITLEKGERSALADLANRVL